MADDVEIAERLKAARKAAGFKTAKAAAESLSVAYPTYAQHESGTRGLTTEAAELYARRYKVTLDWLLRNKGPGPQFVVLEGTLAPDEPAEPKRPTPNASFPPVYQRFSQDHSIPLLGRTKAGPNGRFIMNGTEIGRVFCPPGLEGVEGAYALQVMGESAYPRFKDGETVWVNPHLNVFPGDDVVAQILTDGEDYPVESYIKEFKSRGNGILRLWQHNPAPGETNEITFDLTKVFTVHKVVFHATI